MKIKFTNAKRINPNKDGFDLAYFYRIDDDLEVHQIKISTKLGAEISWNMSERESYEYSMKVFPNVVDFFKLFWENKNELPLEDIEYTENQEINKIGNNEIEWKNYELTLANE